MKIKVNHTLHCGGEEQMLPGTLTSKATWPTSAYFGTPTCWSQLSITKFIIVLHPLLFTVKPSLPEMGNQVQGVVVGKASKAVLGVHHLSSILPIHSLDIDCSNSSSQLWLLWHLISILNSFQILHTLRRNIFTVANGLKVVQGFKACLTIMGFLTRI